MLCWAGMPLPQKHGSKTRLVGWNAHTELRFMHNGRDLHSQQPQPLKRLGLDVCGCEELPILDRNAVAAKRFMSENVRTIGSHDMKETKFSRCPSRAKLFCCCWAGGMPPPQKHGFKKRFVTCISGRMTLMVGRLECSHRNNLYTQRL